MWQDTVGKTVGGNWKTILKGAIALGAYQKFKQSPAMFRTVVGFAVGMYTGVYTAQNYQVPKVITPSEGWDKLTNITGDKAVPPPTK